MLGWRKGWSRSYQKSTKCVGDTSDTDKCRNIVDFTHDGCGENNPGKITNKLQVKFWV